LFDRGILKSYTFNVPIIAVGNLSVGGTGKTPQIEYLIRLLSENFSVATLSRGYKRKSEGFYWLMLLQMQKYLATNRFSFYGSNIKVAVDADRKKDSAIAFTNAKARMILLDDAYQQSKSWFYILLTSYGELYSDDFMLPLGT
jgi:tetraacyldisaccharide 4'-kinase